MVCHSDEFGFTSFYLLIYLSIIYLPTYLFIVFFLNALFEVKVVYTKMCQF